MLVFYEFDVGPASRPIGREGVTGSYGNDASWASPPAMPIGYGWFGETRSLASMEMHQIRYFLAVCDCLNFTRAAETCNVTQPALTRAVQKLEEELGGLLFRRERKYTHMTDLGHLVRPQLEAILAQSERAKSTAKSFLQLKDAPLKLGVMCTIGPMRFIGFLADLRARSSGHRGLADGIGAAAPGGLADGGRARRRHHDPAGGGARSPRPPSAVRGALHDRLRARPSVRADGGGADGGHRRRGVPDAAPTASISATSTASCRNA